MHVIGPAGARRPGSRRPRDRTSQSAVRPSPHGSFIAEALERRYLFDASLTSVDLAVAGSDQVEAITPAVAMDADGDFVVAWNQYDYDRAEGRGIFAQRYHAAGARRGDPIAVATAGEGLAAVSLDVASDSDGDFVVVWQQYDLVDGQAVILAHRFDAAGIPAAGPVTVASESDTTAIGYPTVALDDSGQAAVVWQQHDISNDQTSIVLNMLPDAGPPIAVQIDSYTGLDPDFGVALAIDGQGNLAVSYVAFDAVGDGNATLSVRRFDAQGNAVGQVVRVAQGDPSTEIEQPELAVDADGNLVVAWVELEAGRTRLLAQQFDAQGEPLADPIQVAEQLVEEPEAQIDLAMDADGDFVVVWSWSRNPGDPADLYSRRYDRHGQAQDSAALLAHVSDDSAQSAVAMDEDGDFVVVWHDYDADTYAHHIVGRKFTTPKLPGDLDGNGLVNVFDLVLVLQNWASPVPPADRRADPSGDYFVGTFDLTIVLDNWGRRLANPSEAAMVQPSRANGPSTALPSDGNTDGAVLGPGASADRAGGDLSVDPLALIEQPSSSAQDDADGLMQLF